MLIQIGVYIVERKLRYAYIIVNIIINNSIYNINKLYTKYIFYIGNCLLLKILS